MGLSGLGAITAATRVVFSRDKATLVVLDETRQHPGLAATSARAGKARQSIVNDADREDATALRTHARRPVPTPLAYASPKHQGKSSCVCPLRAWGQGS